MASIALQQVSFKQILTNISVTIAHGSQTALVGSTGAGKSTLLRLLNRLSDRTAGKIFIDGKEIFEIPVPILRRQIMLVPQEVSLLGMTVAEAIRYPLTLRGFPAPEIQTRFQTWSERLKLDSKLMGRAEVELSLGQRQWVAIARALIAEPEVIMLDEPTSALDRGLAQLLLDTLQALTRSPQPQTVIMVNHQLEQVAGWCSHVIQLHKGQLTLSQPADAIDWQDLDRVLKQAIENQTDDDEWD
ncbi:ATP-binding cassette domain-containing protein [Tumidithrix helvetica PCC 7403]|uniref:energy-coupling factor ABC transporter ATP-binding protein n=1 Tax=Tumidithrix helvetica TaxID=3457545 RepID=UPI003C8D04AD